LGKNYLDVLSDIKQRIKIAQIKAVLAVNAEMIILYWEIGKTVLERQQQEGWGTKIIDRLAHDLLETSPDLKDFSAKNLKYMRKFAETYPSLSIMQQAAAQIPLAYDIVAFSFFHIIKVY
jgi:predicted nuclease of restriction endonuclease-like (RecB) superfamily